MTEELKTVNINNINLDLENPRIPLSIRKHDSNKSNDEINNDIIDYMIKTGSIKELILSIGENGFFAGEALILIKDQNNKNNYIVVEGNRRVTALKLLHSPQLAKSSINSINESVNNSSTALKYITEIPSIVFDNREDVLKYLGYRHITGIKNWKALEKARYMSNLYNHFKKDNTLTDDTIYYNISKSIGSQKAYVQRVLKAYSLYQYIEKEDFFNINKLDDTTFHFVNLSDSLNKENIREFLLNDGDVDVDFNKDNLKKLTKWIFEEDSNGKTRLKGTSADLRDLDTIMSNSKALSLFENKEASLQTAVFLAEDSETILSISLENALQHINEAYRVAGKIDKFEKVSKFDDNILELRTIAKNIFEISKQKNKSLDDDI